MKKTPLSRRDWLEFAGACGVVLASGVFRPNLAWADEKANVIDIGSRRELFVDRFLIERMENTALKLHEPIPGGVAIKIDKPWEPIHLKVELKDADLYSFRFIK